MKVWGLAKKATRRAWMKYALRGVGGADNHARLEMAYRLADPWNMDSTMERFRFERTNALIARHFPGVRSMLELGCGEAHQSEHLQRLCASLYGMDVSSTAIERAKARLPQASFAVGDIFKQPWGRERGRFDLVVACEVLYYISDPQKTIDEMNYLGKSCFVTIYAPAARRLGSLIEQQPGLQKDWFATSGTEWLVAFWRSSLHGS